MITPTADGIIIDCKGTGAVWGCGCERCLPRRHPLDLGARTSRKVLDKWTAVSEAVGHRITRTCISCGSSDASFYAGGWMCDEHAPRGADGD